MARPYRLSLEADSVATAKQLPINRTEPTQLPIVAPLPEDRFISGLSMRKPCAQFEVRLCRLLPGRTMRDAVKS